MFFVLATLSYIHLTLHRSDLNDLDEVAAARQDHDDDDDEPPFIDTYAGDVDTTFAFDIPSNISSELSTTQSTPSRRKSTPEVPSPIPDVMLHSLEKHVEAKPAVQRLPKKLKKSRYGIQYPSLPSGVVKTLATSFTQSSSNRRSKISKDTLAAIMQASDWFFEQIGDDLGVYNEHSGRKTLDESDVLTLMKRYSNAAGRIDSML